MHHDRHLVKETRIVVEKSTINSIFLGPNSLLDLFLFLFFSFCLFSETALILYLRQSPKRLSRGLEGHLVLQCVFCSRLQLCLSDQRLKVRKNGQQKMCNLFCNIAAKRVEQRCRAFYHPHQTCLATNQVDQMPPPQGHFTGTKMTEGRRQLSNKIFINITKTEKHCQRIYYEQKSRAKRRKSLLQGH